MKKINWWMVAALTLAAVVVLLGVASLLPGSWGGTSGPEREMTSEEMMSDEWDWGSSSPFSRLLMPLFMFLMPLLWLGIMILGVVWLARAVFSPRDQPTYRPAGFPPVRAEPRGETCAGCGRPVQVDWQICPYCQNELRRPGGER